jgi:hypothetical protein
MRAAFARARFARNFALRMARSTHEHAGMAAVLALVMLPVVMAIGFFIGTVGSDMSFGSAFAGVTFVALAIGVLVGTLRFEHGLEEEVD